MGAHKCASQRNKGREVFYKQTETATEGTEKKWEYLYPPKILHSVPGLSRNEYAFMNMCLTIEKQLCFAWWGG